MFFASFVSMHRQKMVLFFMLVGSVHGQLMGAEVQKSQPATEFPLLNEFMGGSEITKIANAEAAKDDIKLFNSKYNACSRLEALLKRHQNEFQNNSGNAQNNPDPDRFDKDTELVKKQIKIIFPEKNQRERGEQFQMFNIWFRNAQMNGFKNKK